VLQGLVDMCTAGKYYGCVRPGSQVCTRVCNMVEHLNSVFFKGGYIAPLKCIVFVFAMFFSLSVLHAEGQSDIQRFTIDREKTPEIDQAARRIVNLPDIEVSEKSGTFHIDIVAIINAPADYVRYVLTDYSHLYRLNPSILESEILGKDDNGITRVRTRINACAAYFCEELNRVEKVQQLPSGEIYAEIIPEVGQFKFGESHWLLRDLGEQTELTYRSEMRPDIFIPPVVSKFLVKKAIKQEAQTCFTNLENIASHLCRGLAADTEKPSICQ